MKKGLIICTILLVLLSISTTLTLAQGDEEKGPVLTESAEIEKELEEEKFALAKQTQRANLAVQQRESLQEELLRLNQDLLALHTHRPVTFSALAPDQDILPELRMGAP